MNWTLKLEEIDLMRRHVLDKKPTENWTNFHWFEWGQMDLLRRWLKDVHAELKVAQLCLTMGDNSKQTERKLEKDIERYTILREALYERVKDILDHIYSVWGIKGDEEVPV
jgi:hypothetical protein